MADRNEASWNNMISGYVKTGFFLDASGLFLQMWDRGFELNGYVIASLLTAFSRSKSMFLEGLQIHGLVLKNGLLYDVFVATSVLHFYGGFALVSDAQLLFNEMPDRNVVSWTSLMVNLADDGLFYEVVNLYQRMRQAGVGCNQNTFTTVISSCGSFDDEFLVHQVLGHVIKTGHEINVSVANSLVSTFGRFGQMEVACYIFNHMDVHDIISWNSILAAFVHNLVFEEALIYFHLMRLNHGEVNETTLSTVLSVCGSMDKLNWGRGLHGLVLKLGYEMDICLTNTLLTMYFESGRCQDAEQLFHGMPEKDLISWNSMMAGYALGSNCLDALRALGVLLRQKKIINFVTFASALSACADKEVLSEGRIVHGLVIVSGLHENLVVGNALISMYGKGGMAHKAKDVFGKMPEKELVTWNALISGFAENGEVDEALVIFKSMREMDIPSNYITLINVLGSFYVPCQLLRQGMPLHGHILVTGFDSDEYVRNSLISMYACCGDLDSSNLIFYALVNRTPATWNSLVAANAHHGQWEEALKLLREMQRAGVNFDQFSLSAALAASSNLAILEDGQHLHGIAIKLRHGHLLKARETFHEMLVHGSKPDHVSFVAILSACSHGGLVDEGLSYFTSMTSDFGVSAGIEHCVCIVDLLGRSGKLDEAESFIKKMPVPPNDFIWRSLLSACKIHGHLELGKKAAQHLLDANSSDDSAYVLYSNVCATSGKWHDVHRVRVKMETESVKKKPACSWLNIRGKISSFGAGDQSHAESEQIYIRLAQMKKEIKEAGYVPDTSYALHDTDEEQKEDNLWKHSERLALAYGLIETQEGSTLRIFKNLRVCGDCHSVYKFVSSVVSREIILRDPYRFHHFRGGKCSCGDYW
ncbi:pentatricopeptide repeat-containing protein mitochondrial [Dorcoceras hygrometricum]|uniref:Pentatricopeptide repeat-containing protein mitochondrial n=1 Tax=Dorcoceras hygrometricum TaxID=472368 RepID=A0A2Z7D1N5_9LAMI|nr:pentatricopeptide repeat-containing protein mitochondrial [Dorcoceras hygrometricum]